MKQEVFHQYYDEQELYVGKKNRKLMDTVHGTRASAILYSIVETAKAAVGRMQKKEENEIQVISTPPSHELGGDSHL